MASVVTIEKEYFETLLRRAQLHVSPDQYDIAHHLSTVTIPKEEHDHLLRMAREYQILREALYRGGITSETLEVLINNPEPEPEPEPENNCLLETENSELKSDPPAVHNSAVVPVSSGPVNDVGGSSSTSSRPPNTNVSLSRGQDRHLSLGHDESIPSPDSENVDHLYDRTARTYPERHHYPRQDQRTIKLSGLPENATHGDIVDVVRGGMVLDIYLRTFEKSAIVSFVDGSKAQEFLNYAKRRDIYIKNKRIDINWNNKHFTLPAYVSNKIMAGATRNLVVKDVNATITGDLIREHLDHIHNLVVIDVIFKSNNAYIYLNSIHNALFARTCMMSRHCYKGMKIEWYPDECAEPLPKSLPRLKPYSNNSLAKKGLSSTCNRFQMLTIDGSDEEDNEPLTEDYTSINRNINWSDTSIVA